MLIVLVLSSCLLGLGSGTRVTSVKDIRPGVLIWETLACLRLHLQVNVIKIKLKGTGTRQWVHLILHLPPLCVWGTLSPLTLEKPRCQRGGTVARAGALSQNETKR